MSNALLTPARTLAPQSTPAYRVRLAASAAEVRAAQALRFGVFNLELDEGLVHSYDSVVGTYRMQTGLHAAAGLGDYSEREFDFAPFEAQRAQVLELGRACIHQRHRNFAVLNLLWKGIAAYAREHGARDLLGCGSLTLQDEASGLAAFRHLAASLAPAG